MTLQGDYLVRATAFDGQIRAFAVRTTDALREIAERLDLWATAGAALGRTISAGAMMGAMLKGEERLTLSIHGNGPLGRIVVDANAKGDVRGYVTNPHVHFPPNEQGKLDVARAVGKEGTLYVVKDLGLQEPYRGSSPIISGEIAEDFTYYFATSEQTPSAVGLGVLVNPDHSILASGGFILQLMPDAEEEAIHTLEERLKSVPSVSGMVGKGLTPEEMLEEVIGGKVHLLHEQPIRFHCGCSYEKSLAALSSLGTEVLKEYVEKGEEPEILCHFCHERYVIPVSAVEEMIKKRELNETT